MTGEHSVYSNSYIEIIEYNRKRWSAETVGLRAWVCTEYIPADHLEGVEPRNEYYRHPGKSAVFIETSYTNIINAFISYYIRSSDFTFPREYTLTRGDVRESKLD